MKNLNKIIKESVTEVLKEEFGNDNYDALKRDFITLNQIEGYLEQARALVMNTRFKNYDFARELGAAQYDITDAFGEVKRALIDMGMTREEYQQLRQQK